MSRIDIQHRHSLSGEDAHAKLQHIADTLAGQHGAQCQWQGDQLCFSRPGLDGKIELQPGCVHVSARLGLLLSPLHTRLSDEVQSLLARHFPPA